MYMGGVVASYNPITACNQLTTLYVSQSLNCGGYTVNITSVSLGSGYGPSVNYSVYINGNYYTSLKTYVPIEQWLTTSASPPVLAIGISNVSQQSGPLEVLINASNQQQQPEVRTNVYGPILDWVAGSSAVDQGISVHVTNITTGGTPPYSYGYVFYASVGNNGLYEPSSDTGISVQDNTFTFSQAGNYMIAFEVSDIFGNGAPTQFAYVTVNPKLVIHTTTNSTLTTPKTPISAVNFTYAHTSPTSSGESAIATIKPQSAIGINYTSEKTTLVMEGVNSSKEINVTVNITNVTVDSPPAPASYQKLNAYNLSVDADITITATSYYNCSIPSSYIAPFILKGGIWIKISNYTVDGLGCLVNYTIPSDPIVAIMENEGNATHSRSTTVSNSTTSVNGTIAAKSGRGRYNYWDYAIAVLVIIILILGLVKIKGAAKKPGADDKGSNAFVA